MLNFRPKVLKKHRWFHKLLDYIQTNKRLKSDDTRGKEDVRSQCDTGVVY